MKFFKPSLVSLFVCSTFAAAGVNAGSNSLSSYYASAQSTSSDQVNLSVKQLNMSQQKTVSGMRSHYDKNLARATFLWAAQDQRLPALSPVAPELRNAVAAEHYLNNLTGVTTRKSDENRAVLSYMSVQKSGSIIAKYTQKVAGVEVFNREFNVVMNDEHRLVAASGFFANTKASSKLLRLGANFTSANDAIANAFAAIGGDKTNIQLTAVESNDPQNKYTHFNVINGNDSYHIVGEPRAKKVMFELGDKLVPAYYVEIEAGNVNKVNSDYIAMVISSVDGKVLFKNNLNNSEAAFGYRVYAQTDKNNIPLDGPMGDVSPWNPEVDEPTVIELASLVNLTSGPISTNDPWLADDATITSGNNVNAYVDAIAPQGFSNGDYHAELTSANVFDYPLDMDQGHNSINNRKSAIVNLFYVVNYLHDQFYDHGFDEASGNAQMINFERGGIEGDPINAEAQDNSGFNNANMSTPADGVSPRMQMYLYDSNNAIVGDDYGVSLLGSDTQLLQSAQRSGFGAPRFGEIKGEVVSIDDGTDTVTDGCEAAVNGDELAGNIVIIDRGACNFTAKVKNAQDAGAIAVIIANDDRDPAGLEPAPMGGDDDSVTIANMGISFNDGKLIYDAIAAGTAVEVSLFNQTPFKDGTFDNGTVAHEWGHYISNRLVGNSSGLINNQGGSMGEGWGDFHALMLFVRAEDVNLPDNDKFQAAYSGSGYTDSFYSGIRRAPYSTNMDINPLTFKHIEKDVELPENVRQSSDNAEVHAAGEIWTLALWEVYVGLINDDRHTFDEAQSLMMDYLVAGYKMTPIAPTYTEARDAILAVAYANDAEDYKVMLKGFAKRGLGLGAVSPDRFSQDHAGVVESFETELATYSLQSMAVDSSFDSATVGFCTNDNIWDKGETAQVTVTIVNRGSEVLTNVKALLAVDGTQDVTFANDGEVTFDSVAPYATATARITVTLNDAATADTLNIAVTFPELETDDAIVEADADMLAVLVNVDFEQRSPIADSTFDDIEGVTSSHDWQENVQFGGAIAKGTFYIDTTVAPFLADYGFETGAKMLGLTNNGFKSDVSIESQSFDVGYGNNFSVSWWHYVDLEESWDGGVAEVSINGAAWIDVTKVGGTFA
ncbi:MAG: peptidase, partial [Gammaproteobacteria bacterium]|nr:peptidase [Gammaproteobacteria bacterium]